MNKTHLRISVCLALTLAACDASVDGDDGSRAGSNGAGSGGTRAGAGSGGTRAQAGSNAGAGGTRATAGTGAGAGSGGNGSGGARAGSGGSSSMNMQDAAVDPMPDGGMHDAGQDPADTVPVVVATSDGGWSMASCDLGLSWVVNPQFSNDRDDHAPWNNFGGVAFKAGRFVAAYGWGNPGHVVTSTNGVTWTEVPDASFSTGNLNNAISAVVVTPTEFILFGDPLWRSTDGLTWHTAANTWPSSVQQVRQARGFASENLLVGGAENQTGQGGHAQGYFAPVSSNGGESWTEGTGFRSSCGEGIQAGGDIAMADGVLIVVGSSDVCRSGDRGATWEAFTSPAGGPLLGVFAGGGDFYGFSGTKFMHSTDGRTWTMLGQTPTASVRGAYVDGHFVAIETNAGHVYHSEDGQDWDDVTPTISGTPPWIRDVAVGYAPENTACVR